MWCGKVRILEANMSGSNPQVFKLIRMKIKTGMRNHGDN